MVICTMAVLISKLINLNIGERLKYIQQQHRILGAKGVDLGRAWEHDREETK